MKISYPSGLTIEQQIERIVAALNNIDENNLASTIDLTEIIIVNPGGGWTGDLIPSLDDNFDIGNTTKEWKDIYIDGKAYIDALGQSLDGDSNSLTNFGSITGASFVIGGNTLDTTEWANLDGQDQAVKTSDDVTFNDITVTTPSNIYALSHDSFTDFVANEHIDWTDTTNNLRTTGTLTTTGINALCYQNDVLCYENEILFY